MDTKQIKSNLQPGSSCLWCFCLNIALKPSHIRRSIERLLCIFIIFNFFFNHKTEMVHYYFFYRLHLLWSYDNNNIIMIIFTAPLVPDILSTALGRALLQYYSRQFYYIYCIGRFLHIYCGSYFICIYIGSTIWRLESAHVCNITDVSI